MKTKFMMMMAAAALVLTSCSNDDETDNWNGEIRLSSGLAVQTRANNTDVPDKQIAENQTVYTWVDKVPISSGDAATAYINAWTLTAQGNGTFMGNAQYYPADGAKLDFYAMHGNFTFTENGDVFPTTAINHDVAANQSTNLGENYLKSDLLYGLKTEVTRSGSAVNLTFYHLLSKVEVALKSGAGSPNLVGATVTIENTRLKASFTPSKTADINNSVSETAQAARAGLVTCPTDNNDVTSIAIATKMATGDFAAGTEYAAAIIVPQTVAEGTQFIKVVLANNGGTFTYKVPNEITFESGKKYQYQITVNKSSLSVTSSISGWSPITAITGEATMSN
ncbi:fimbrillin family protein [Bacteroides timonensis]|uniref:fimbrillin family protein n=1 Tax=Bacteroides timonensis TaxID=1470345 RepID=UPI0004B65AF4|nr:fimbrillin family protein [Bacteroides timonensis]